ncbi:hypothetical protein BO83DRAFT_29981 [Aspergillus eucalypticola CBS 122712]|uniref:Uncharacterized protein n=1 Tax=Aspergillus eucalypticola (strain CBS 122712 / IBT 29274) TaxID=1448314 RepID=A0A317VK65_ASPEC|nr:uncharacterized protein BO83DRAFT_29981 [Aspergillus eucalypticola CBS 122712]PWY73272.1 hypothetical protein BO83DRAFT_29981 [Aspergillus eucalypticola CBS 122712]
MPTDSHAVFLSTAAPVNGVTELHIGHVFPAGWEDSPTSRLHIQTAGPCKRRKRKEKSKEREGGNVTGCTRAAGTCKRRISKFWVSQDENILAVCSHSI